MENKMILVEQLTKIFNLIHAICSTEYWFDLGNYINCHSINWLIKEWKIYKFYLLIFIYLSNISLQNTWG